MTGNAEALLADSKPLSVGSATAALITLPDGRYVLQHRDNIPGIWFPGYWCLFGGAVEPDEGPEAAMRRELKEEIEFEAGPLEQLFSQTFELTAWRIPPFRRIYFLAPASLEQFAAFRLHEGAGFAAFTAAEILGGLSMVPYDAFAIFLHQARDRLRVYGGSSH
jgi:8-oxo-dGTP pyrophosphatase MutT (NUDIX family)